MAVKTRLKLREPKWAIIRNMARRKPKSPMRLRMNAFLPASTAEFLQVVKADQQVGGETYALPADEHQQEVLRQHQRQHEKHEEVEVGEETPVSLFVRHVADGVDVDQKAHAGDDQQHDQRQRVEQEGKIGAKGRRLNPGKRQLLVIRQSETAEAEGDAEDQSQRSRGKEQGNGRDQRLAQITAQQSIQQKADEWQQRDQPQMEGWISVHSFIRLI